MITGKLITRAASSSLATRTTSEFFAISAQLLSLSVGLTPVIEKGRDPLDSVRVSDKSSSDGNPPSVPRETEKRKKNSGHRGGGEALGRDFTENKIRFAHRCILESTRGCLV